MVLVTSIQGITGVMKGITMELFTYLASLMLLTLLVSIPRLPSGPINIGGPLMWTLGRWPLAGKEFVDSDHPGTRELE